MPLAGAAKEDGAHAAVNEQTVADDGVGGHAGIVRPAIVKGKPKLPLLLDPLERDLCLNGGLNHADTQQVSATGGD